MLKIAIRGRWPKPQGPNGLTFARSLLVKEKLCTDSNSRQIQLFLWRHPERTCQHKYLPETWEAILDREDLEAEYTDSNRLKGATMSEGSLLPTSLSSLAESLQGRAIACALEDPVTDPETASQEAAAPL